MKTITNRQQLQAFFNTQLGTFASDDFRGIAMYRDGEDDLTAAVGYNGFVGRVCSMHAVVRKPVTREMIRAAFDYPFKQCGLNAVLVQVDSTNVRSLVFCQRLGFKWLATVPQGGLEDDLGVLMMTKQDWSESEYGQKVRSTCA